MEKCLKGIELKQNKHTEKKKTGGKQNWNEHRLMQPFQNAAFFWDNNERVLDCCIYIYLVSTFEMVMSLDYISFIKQAVVAPEMFLWGHRGGKKQFWGGKNQKICKKWLILATFSFWLGGMWGQSLRLGGGANAPMPPLDAATESKQESKWFSESK